MTKERKNHWETIYQSKEPHQLSWTQEIPQISLDFIYLLNLDKAAAIIDIGGGNSNLVNFLINDGYTNITVLDISAKALDKTKKRLGDRAETVNWIVGDVTEFEPATMFDVWHDRAAFHFLTTRKDIAKYIKITKKCVTGHIIIGTFSKKWPTKM
jgi:trans-aconitate methyltransferase